MVRINVTGGTIEGERLNSELVGTYYSFKGIPYAEPPIGDLRFRPPRSIKPWSGIRSAKAFGPVCPQLDLLFRTTLPSSEDCLYLNVYSPDVAPKKLLDVMVWIHGGGFFCGSGNDNYYGPEYLLQRDVVLVTFNYRLGAFGFLSLDTEELPGNSGIKDQVAALRWVRKNIRNFGGDPDKVTIFGESAGGTSVAFHLISPMSKGLFKRAIVQSGVTINCWAEMTDARKRALVLAKNLGCYAEDDNELAKFFKSQPTEALVAQKMPLTFLEDGRQYPELYFGIINEKKINNIETFNNGDDFENILKNIHEGVEIMVGYTSDEGLLVAGLIQDLDKALRQTNTNLEYFVPKSMYLNNKPHKSHEIGIKIKEFFFNSRPVDDSTVTNLLSFYGSAFFYYDIVTWARIAASTKRNKLYFYKFTCKSERNIFNYIFGGVELYKDDNVTCHADEIPYLFTNEVSDKEVKFDSKEHRMIGNVTKLWTNFAKYGNPTPDDSLKVKWPEYDVKDQTYLDIGEELVVHKCPNKEEVDFWDSIIKEYHPKRSVDAYY